ncbi:MAG: YihY family inner membrane protein [Elusimicrobia bacterium]|nr:YihY family inner membrane protein [Elusimicrobiota bacterium]
MSKLSLAQRAWFVAGALAAAVFARAALPLVLTRVLNRLLRKVSPYRGTLDDADIDLWKGRLVIRGLRLTAPAEKLAVPAATIGEISLKLDWKQLFRGAIVASADIDKPAVLIRANAEPPKPKETAATPAPPDRRPMVRPLDPSVQDESRWNRKVAKLPPIRIDHIGIHGGEVHVQGVPGQGGSDLRAENLNVRVENITNSINVAPSLAARLHADAHILGAGRFRLDGRAFPLADSPTFEVDVALRDVDLTELSDLSRARVATELRSGQLSLVAEAAAAEGRIRGYAKPLIEHLETARDGGDGAVQGAVLRNIARLLRNAETGRIATRVDFEGDLKHPDVGVATALKTTLVNAFSKPLPATFEETAEVTIPAVDAEAMRERTSKPKRPSKLKAVLGVFKEAFRRFGADNAPRMGATLSYYTAFSMAPLLLLAISVAGMVFGRDAVEGRVVGQLSGMIGHDGAAALQSMIQAAQKTSSAAAASVIGVISLLLGASAVMSELKFALNKIWGAHARTGLKATISDKLLSVGMVLVLGFLLLVSLVASAALTALGKYLGNVLPIPAFVMETLNVLLSFAVFASMFAAMFKSLPDAKIKWADVWVGAIATAFLFIVGKFALGAYIGRGTVGSSYGAAGSVLVILLWIYYSAQILYFGAEFTKAYSDQLGTGVKPSAADIPEKLAY